MTRRNPLDVLRAVVARLRDEGSPAIVEIPACAHCGGIATAFAHYGDGAGPFVTLRLCDACIAAEPPQQRQPL